MSSNRRMSFSGPRPNVLRDSSNSAALPRASSVSRRRMSFGGKAIESSSNAATAKTRDSTPQKQNYAMLSEWRKQARSSSRDDENGGSKRSRVNDFVEGESALEAYRRRKMQRQQQNQGDTSFDDNDDTFHGNSKSTTVLASTPRSGLRLGGAARRRTVMNAQRPILPPTSMSQESDTSLYSIGGGTTTAQSAASFSQQSIDFDTDQTISGVGTVEDVGLRSQIREMQLRIDILEKDKMDLKMKIAPLEARFRSKEDGWVKEQNRLLDEVESLKDERQKLSEKNRDLEMQYDRVREECKHLQFEVRKASSSLNNTTDNSVWGRQLQNDRDVAELKQKLRYAEDEINSLRLDKVSVEKELHATNIALDSMTRNFDELTDEYNEVSKSTSVSKEAEIQLEHLTTEHIATSAQLNAVCADLAATKARAEATQEASAEMHRKEIEQLQFDICVLKTRTATAAVSRGKAEGKDDDGDDVAVLKAKIEERERRLLDLERKLLEGETLRRQMHNRIQELRGNIRVFVRTRPFLPYDGHCEQAAIDVLPDGESLSITDMRSAEPTAFKFDKVFPPSAGQDQVFQEVADFVQSALDGYHVCLFSYGQTGSGKTHTMQGSGNGAMRGIIPRAVEQILNQAKAMESNSWTFSLHASFLEIYNETLKDLLLAMSHDKNAVKDPPKLAIKRSREGKSFVEGLTEVKIDTDDVGKGILQLDALMGVAARSRSVARTNMNAQSSRSHSIFVLNLSGYNKENGAEVSGVLNLCDLAGSERLDRSGAGTDAQRLRETQAINKSLSCLGDVFNSLAQGSSHVPYRNSKLTYLLQDCLSGDGKALMFVNLSPTPLSSNESLCSLRFAQRVNQVELGKPTKRVTYNR